MFTKAKSWYIDSFKNRNYLLVGLAILFFITAYFISIKPTVKLFSRYKKLTQNLNSNIEQVDVSSLRAQVDFYDHYIYSEDQNAFLPQLLEKATHASSNHQTSLMAFSIANDEKGDGWNKRIYLIQLSGNYRNIIATLDQLHKELSGGILKSYNFQMERDRKTRKDYLSCSVYIESISYEKK